MRSILRARFLRAVVAALVLVVATPAVASADRSSAAERRLVELMNAERASAGLPALKVADDLTAVAYGWSVESAARFGKSGGTAHNPSYADTVCCWSALGENVGWASGSDPMAAAEMVHRSFMKSSGHRDNIVDKRFSQVGVGVEVHRSGTVYVTVNFRRPSGDAPKPSSAPKSEAAPEPKPAPTRSPTRTPAPAAASEAEQAEEQAVREEAEARRAEEARRLEARREELEARRVDLRERFAAFQVRRAEADARRAELAARRAQYQEVAATALAVLVRIDALWGVVQRPMLQARAGSSP